MYYPLNQNHQHALGVLQIKTRSFQNDYLKTPRKLFDVLWTAGTYTPCTKKFQYEILILLLHNYR